MAVYKVPQDVEADDKLLGPFSFRQFIYLIIVAVAIAIGWGLSRLFIPLAILPIPVVLFFGVLALPLRKDQPMEIYMAAIVSFYLKPRKRLWKADGIQSLVEITAPKVIEVQRMKDISQVEAQQRLSYLADIVDTGGWAVRGVSQPEVPSAMQSDVYFEAQQTEDILGTDGGVARNFETMISQADAKRHQDVLERMRQPELQPVPTPAAVPSFTPQVVDPYATFTPASLQPTDPTQNFSPIEFNPYPSSMRQHVITPLSDTPVAQSPPPQVQPQPVAPAPQQVAPPPSAQPLPPPAPSTSEKPPSPDILNLANNSDLSIETIAHEAKRIHEKQEEMNEEVVISLR